VRALAKLGLSATLLLASLLIAPAPALAADVGVEGPSYAGAGAEPTGEKPESKLWFNDGIWWGSLWDTASGRYEIFRLNGATWASTNVPLDTRSNSRADTLWDGTSLYVASHVFATTPATGTPSNLYKFSYNPATDTYSLVGGWPQQINNVRTETLVIDKDSTGQLWATWVQKDSANKRRVHVNRTLSGDSGWGAPFVVPGTSAHTQVGTDDISSVIAFGGNKIGVLWSNQRVTPKTFNFIVHDDSAGDTIWGPSVAITGGSRFGDDHINLKSLHTDGSGRVFAIIKTSNTGPSDPLIVVLTRSSGGSWSQRTVWTRGNNLTRPLVLVDTSNGLLHAFASTEGGGKVYYKSATLTGSFPGGLGTVVMADDAQDDINNVTSGKGNVSSSTGLLVLASNQTTQRYWHHFDALSGGGGNDAPVCSDRSLTVAEDSAGGDVAPSCTDSDGPSALTYAIADQGTKGVATVTGSNQLHYTPNPDATGADTFTYTAFDGADTSAPATVSVTITPSGGGGTPVTVAPVADTYVASDQPTSSHGTANTLRTRTSSSAQLNTFLRFTFSGVGPASTATLRLFVNDASVDAGKLYQVLDDSWSESMLYDDQPALGPLIVDLGAVTAGAYRDIDVSSYVTTDGTYSFAIIGEVNDLARFDSREAANDPLLVVTP
jgi:hypothetical protein